MTCVQPERVQASILAHLLAWALQEEELVATRLLLLQTIAVPTEPLNAPLLPKPEQGQEGVLSEWMLATLSVDLLRRQVAGHLSAARFRDCLPRLGRFLRINPRRRTHWYSQTWNWLTSSEDSASLLAEVR